MTYDIEKLINTLMSELHSYHISVTSEQCSLLLKHLLLVLEKNKEFNLTRIIDINDGIYKHILDSLMSLPCITDFGFAVDNNDISVLDIGSGAGYPGIPIALTTQWHVSLIDSSKKKVDALRQFLQVLRIDSCSLYNDRIELFALNSVYSYDIVIARAVAELSILIEYASPLLYHGAYGVFLKGIISNEERQHASYVAKLCGMQHVTTYNMLLPHNYGQRTIYIYRKYAPSRVTLPRRPGIAHKHPLYSYK